MNIDKQIDLIRNKQPIDDNGPDEARLVFRSAVRTFRMHLSPVLTPPQTWHKNVMTMLGLCRLAKDPQAQVELLAVRAAAQVDSTIKPGDYDELALAAGLDILASSKTSIGYDDARILIEKPGAPRGQGGYAITLGKWTIRINDAPIEQDITVKTVVEAATAIDKLDLRNTGGKQYVEIEYDNAPANDTQLNDSVHDPWRPTTVFNPKFRPHPTDIIEPSTLAATPFPPATYRPLLPTEALTRGALSDAQLECVVYMLQAVTNRLPGSPTGSGPAPKGGFILGDGTGVGKTREICAAILDQWMRGIKRHIIVVERATHVEHVKEDWRMLGGNPRDIFYLGDTAATDPVPDRDGVLIVTYALTRSDQRYQAIFAWANARKPLDGLICFDEAQAMANAVEDEFQENGYKGNKSQQGEACLDLQDAHPDAGVIYSSATMASSVYNLACAPRLGIWGKNAPFFSAKAFISEMHALDDNALEQICIDLKAAGRYISRNLSFEGVEYDELVHQLTQQQRRTFDATVRSFGTLRTLCSKALYECRKKHPGNSKRTASNAGAIASLQKRTISNMLTSFNMETVIEDIHDELAAGNAPVIQVALTGEARLRRILEAEGPEVDEETFSDNEIVSWIKNSFPLHEQRKDGLMWTDVLDGDGKPIPVPEAAKLRQQALDIADTFEPQISPIDKLYRAFGQQKVAEITGRSLRAVPETAKNGEVTWIIDERSPAESLVEVEAFNNDHKDILVFSLGAGGTGLSYHASKRFSNKRRRVHYVLELGHQAKQAVQGIGRTHRSDQVIAPVVKLCRADIPAHAILAARTLSKIGKMGALSRGHQHATTNAIFEQRIPMKGKYAQLGWEKTLRDVEEGRFRGLTLDILAKDTGLSKGGEHNNLHSIEHAIGKIALLTDGDQRELLDALIENTDAEIANAIRKGEYNQGLETIRADSIEIASDGLIENANGSTTKYYRLRKKVEIEKTPYTRATMAASRTRLKGGRAVFMRHKINGRIVLGMTRDNLSSVVDLISPSGSFQRPVDAIREEPWKVLTDTAEIQELWQTEFDNLDMREISDLHMLSGSLLYNWNKLPRFGHALNRCRTDDGQTIVGRIIPRDMLRETLSSLGMPTGYTPVQLAGMLGKVDQGAQIDFDNGWNIQKSSSPNGNYRLIIPHSEQTGMLASSLQSIGVKLIRSPLEDLFEIPRAEAVDVLGRLVIGCEISLAGQTTQNVAMQQAA